MVQHSTLTIWYYRYLCFPVILRVEEDGKVQSPLQTENSLER